MKNNIYDLMCKMCKKEPTPDEVLTDVSQTIDMLQRFGITKINLRLLSKSSVINNVCNLENFDVAANVSTKTDYAYYTTFNLINDECEPSNIAIKDSDIYAYRFMLIDIDPERPSGCCATDKEKLSAVATADDIWLWLNNNGIPKSHVIIADSGNGIHLLVPLNFINPSAATNKIKEVLSLLHKRFSNDEAKVDTSVYNPSRITRLYGTINCKGENTPDRPHRQSKLLFVPNTVVAGLDIEKIDFLIKKLKQELHIQKNISTEITEKSYEEKPYVLAKGEEWIKYHNLEYGKPKIDEYGNCLYPFYKCPLREHTNNSSGASFIITKHGKCKFQCLHQSCSERDILDFMEKYPCPDEYLIHLPENTVPSPTSLELPTIVGLKAGKKYHYGPYTLSERGITLTHNKGVEVISAKPFFVSKQYRNIDTNYLHYEIKFINGEEVSISVSSDTFSPNKLSELSKYGIILITSPQKTLKYLTCQMNQIPMTYIHSLIGWNIDKSGTPTFRLNELYGGQQNSLLDNPLYKLESLGSFKEWKQMVIDNVINTNMEIALCVGFSSIVLGYLSITDKPDIGSLIINFYGQSTSGKTTALHLINSIYSNPFDNRLYSFSATQNALIAILHNNKGVTTTIDELSASSSGISEMLYQMGQGTSRLRLDADSTPKKQYRFNTVIATTSEVPMANYLKTNEGLRMRYIELSTKTGETWTKNASVAEEITRKCAQYFGTASKEFIEKLLRHDHGTDYIKLIYRKAYAELLGQLPDSHYKSRICTAYAIVLSSALLIQELLALPIRVDKVREFLIETEKRTYEQRDEIPVDLYDKIVEYTYSHYTSFNIINCQKIIRNKVGFIKPNKNGVYRVYFLKEEFQKILKREFSIVNVDKVIDKLIKDNKLISEQGRRIKYIHDNKVRHKTYCIELPDDWKSNATNLGIL